jgi:hypothetical protein
MVTNGLVQRTVLVGLVVGLITGGRLWAQQTGSWPTGAGVPAPAQPPQPPAANWTAYPVAANSFSPSAPVAQIPAAYTAAQPAQTVTTQPAAPVAPSYPVAAGSYSPPAQAAPESVSYPMMQPVQPVPQPLPAEHPSGLRGLLARPSEPLPPELFTPFMLGDYSRVNIGLASDFKIAEGDSPRPTDRIFYLFNYYNNVDKNRFISSLESVHGVDLYNHVFGFEKTLFDGLVSLELRIPFHTIDADAKQFTVTPSFSGGTSVVGPGGPGFSDTEFGDITAIAKVVLLEERATGSLLSAGLAVTLPTADNLQGSLENSTTFVQPFVGYILNRGNFFVQGFTSVTLPVTNDEAIVLFNDIGAGYYVYRANCSGLLTAVAPTLELHVITPLRQPAIVEAFEPVENLRLKNIVDLTLGTTLEFGNRATLGLGVVASLSNPKPFDFGALAQLNYRF